MMNDGARAAVSSTVATCSIDRIGNRTIETSLQGRIMKLHRLFLVAAVMLVVSPLAVGQEQRAGQSEMLEELRALSARLDAMEARHIQEREEYEQTIAILRSEISELRNLRPAPELEDQQDLNGNFSIIFSCGINT